MKRKGTRTVLLVLIIMASFSSYLYLNYSSLSFNGNEEEAKEFIYEDMDAQSPNNTYLPDARILQKAAELGRRVIPTH